MRNHVYLAGIVLTMAVASHLAFDVSRAGQPSFVWMMGVPTVLLALVALARAKHDGVLDSWVSVRGGDFSRGFAAAGLLFGASYAFMRLVAPPTSPRASWLARLYLQLGDPAVLRREVGTVVLAIVVIAIAEELVWRGLVPSLLEEILGSRYAWVVSAVLYALAHVPTAWALRDPVSGLNPVVVLGALGCGLVWGGMRRTFDRLWPAAFSHILFDWAVLMMFRLWGASV